MMLDPMSRAGLGLGTKFFTATWFVTPSDGRIPNCTSGTSVQRKEARGNYVSQVTLCHEEKSVGTALRSVHKTGVNVHICLYMH